MKIILTQKNKSKKLNNNTCFMYAETQKFDPTDTYKRNC